MENKKSNPLIDNLSDDQRLGLLVKIEKITAKYIGKSQFYVTASWDGKNITITAK